MNYKVDSDYVKRVLEIKKETESFIHDPVKTRQYINEQLSTDNEHIQLAISGYLDSLEKAAEMAGVELDLTYDTISSLPVALTALAMLQAKGGYEKNRNAVVLMHTLAAYLTLLAVNNHDLKVSIEQMTSDLNASRPELWVDMYSMKFNLKKKSDFRIGAMKCLDSPFEVENGFFININPLVSMYKKVTGVDLDEYGFNSIIIQGLNN